jgi:hypothetical protein
MLSSGFVFEPRSHEKFLSPAELSHSLRATPLPDACSGTGARSEGLAALALTKFNDYRLVRVVGADALPKKSWSRPQPPHLPPRSGPPLAALLERTTPEPISSPSISML